MKLLGSTQLAVLDAMRDRHAGQWYAGCGWIWRSTYATQRIMDSLVKRGFVTVTIDRNSRRVYRVALWVDAAQLNAHREADDARSVTAHYEHLAKHGT